MRAIRISDEAYEFLSYMSRVNKRTLVSTLDLFIDIFKEVEDEKKLEKKSVSPCKEKSFEFRREKLATNKKKGI